MPGMLLATLWTVGSSIATASPPPAVVFFEHVTVIDGVSEAAQSDMTVVVTGEKITSLCPSGRARVPHAAMRIAARGKFLIPGLWDMHVHLTDLTEIACPTLLANGVTSVRDMGGELELIDFMRDQVARNVLVGPTIYRAGPFVDGPKPGVPDRLVVATAEDGRTAARFLKSRGVDYIKTHTGTPREAYFALIAEARSRGLHVVGHVPFDVTPQEAVDAEQFSIEHVVSFTPISR